MKMDRFLASTTSEGAFQLVLLGSNQSEEIRVVMRREWAEEMAQAISRVLEGGAGVVSGPAASVGSS